MTDEFSAENEPAAAADDAAEAVGDDQATLADDAAPDSERVILTPDALDRAVEALLIVADEPLSVVTIATSTAQPVRAVRASIARLRDDYDGAAGAVRRAFELREVAGGWRLYARAEHDDLIAGMLVQASPARLSQAALETLAVIAYKQPISRGQVAAIRAVNVDSVVRTLLGRGLIEEAFTDPETGAIHYGTTDALLGHLGLNSLDELPKISPLLPDGSDGFEGVDGVR